MLPDKSIASLVKYYYSWKKTRFRTSVMDRQARKLQAGVLEESDHSVDENANAGADLECNANVVSNEMMRRGRRGRR